MVCQSIVVCEISMETSARHHNSGNTVNSETAVPILFILRWFKPLQHHYHHRYSRCACISIRINGTLWFSVNRIEKGSSIFRVNNMKGLLFFLEKKEGMANWCHQKLFKAASFFTRKIRRRYLVFYITFTNSR